MARDVLLIRFRGRVKDVSGLGSDEQPIPLGSFQDVHEAVTAIFPGTDWSDPGWGFFSGGIGSVKFNVGKEEPVKSLALHLRADDAIVNGILSLCARLDCRALDLSSASFMAPPGDPEQTLQRWRACLDQMAGGGNLP